MKIQKNIIFNSIHFKQLILVKILNNRMIKSKLNLIMINNIHNLLKQILSKIQNKTKIFNLKKEEDKMIIHSCNKIIHQINNNKIVINIIIITHLKIKMVKQMQ